MSNPHFKSNSNLQIIETIESSNNLVCLISSEGQFLYLNRLAREALKTENLTTIQIGQVLRLKDGSDPQKTLIQKVLKEGIWSGQCEWVSDPSRTLKISLSAIKMDLDAQQTTILLSGTLQEQKVEELRSSQDPRSSHLILSSLSFLTKILDKMPSMVFIKDCHELRYIYINKAGEDLTGYSQEELIGKNDSDFFPKEEAEHFLNYDKQVIASGNSIDIQEELISTRSRGLRYLHTKKVIITTNEGTKFLLGISDDITAQKSALDENKKLRSLLEERINSRTQELKTANERLQAESTRTHEIFRALEANETQLRLIANALPMLVAYVDTELAYTFANSAFEKWYGKPVSELLGSTIKEVVGSEFYKKLEAYIQQALSGKVVEFTVSSKDKIGRSKELSISYLPDHSETGAIRGFVEITQDITERKRHEEEKSKLLVREQAARDASEMKSEFLANMSHEIRTPINGVIGMTGLLIDTPLNPEQKEYAENIKRSANSLLTVINDILDFSKVESGKIEFENITFDLVSTFQDLEKTFRFTAESKGLKLVQELDPNLPLFVKGDPGRIRQVVTNLVGNAIKFTQKGQVTVRLGVVKDTQDSSRIECQVEDTGIGITNEAKERLFQPFSQGSKSIFRQYGGTGLGLSISKKLLEIMGGEIGVTNKTTGALFWFRVNLPKMEEPKIDGAPLKIMDREKAKNFRILVAEDNIINQQIAVKILQKMGFKTDAVSNGKEVLQALKDIPYDLVLMDCQMPEMDGYEATANIRRDIHLPNHIPIIAMTANAMKGDCEKCLEAGMDDYLSKPISEKRLATILNGWMSRLEEYRRKMGAA